MLREAAGVPISDLPDFGAPARNGNGNGAKAKPAERTPAVAPA